MRLVYATRRSKLALAQSRAFVAMLQSKHPGLVCEELTVVTSGDRIVDRPLSEVGGKGLFVKEIEEALLEGRAHFAVHSIKDVPGVLPAGLSIGCVPSREDPRDVLVSPKFGTLHALPPHARVGTSSLRRLVALKRARPDLEIVPMRGNVDTRLRKVDEGECDAIVLAFSGLRRLGLAERVTEVLPVDVSLPAVGQGALGIELRTQDAETHAILASVADATTSFCVAAERGVMVALEGDCRTPIAAFAERVASGDMRLHAFVAEPDGTHFRELMRTSPWPASQDDAHTFGLALGEALSA